MDEDEGIRDLLRAVRRHGILVAAMTAGGAGVGLAMSLLAPPRYTSEAVLPLPSVPALQFADRIGENPPGASLAALLPSSAVLAAVAQGSVRQAGAVDEKLGVIVFHATAATPEGAREEAARAAASARPAIAETLSPVLRSHLAFMLAAARLERVYAARASASARALAAEAASAGASDAAGSRASDLRRAALATEAAHVEMRLNSLDARISSLEEFLRDPGPLLGLFGYGSAPGAPPIAAPASARPRNAARSTAAGGVLGLLASLTIVFVREASAPQRTA